MDPAKWVSREDIAGTMLFLCSPAADSITGASISMFGKM
jgi:hypothetical protein